MFKKRTQNNFSPDLSLARIHKLIPSSDGKQRKVEIKYLGGNSNVDLLEGVMDKKGMKTTLRDTRNIIIVISPGTQQLNQELEKLSDLIKDQERIALFNSYPSEGRREVNSLVTSRCMACHHSHNTPQRICPVCLLNSYSQTQTVFVNLSYQNTTQTVTYEVPSDSVKDVLEILGRFDSFDVGSHSFIDRLNSTVMSQFGHLVSGCPKQDYEGEVKVALFSLDHEEVKISVFLRKDLPKRNYFFKKTQKALDTRPPIHDPDKYRLDISHATRSIVWPSVTDTSVPRESDQSINT